MARLILKTLLYGYEKLGGVENRFLQRVEFSPRPNIWLQSPHRAPPPNRCRNSEPAGQERNETDDIMWRLAAVAVAGQAPPCRSEIKQLQLEWPAGGRPGRAGPGSGGQRSAAALRATSPLRSAPLGGRKEVRWNGTPTPLLRCGPAPAPAGAQAPRRSTAAGGACIGALQHFLCVC